MLDMLTIIKGRLKDLNNHICYLKDNQSKLIVNKYGGSHFQWEEKLIETESKLVELENCIKTYNKVNKTI